MKNAIQCLVFVLCLLVGFPANAQTYLVDTYTPTDGYACTTYKSTSGGSMKMMGDVELKGGFFLDYYQGETKPRFVEFNIQGQYKTLMFALGHKSNLNPYRVDGIVVIHADGKKIYDKIWHSYDVPEIITLDVEGVKQIRFEVVKGPIFMQFAEMTLWKAGQTPKFGKPLLKAKPEKTVLVKDLKPYFYNVQIFRPQPQLPGIAETGNITINGVTYPTGFEIKAQQAIIGNSPGWAHFFLGKQFSKLKFVSGPGDSQKKAGAGWITIKCDGKIVYEKEINQISVAKEEVVDITGCNMLSIESEQSKGSLNLCLADLTIYPVGQDEGLVVGSSDAFDPRLTELPDVCKLITSIPPYTVQSAAPDNLFDGKSDHLCFEMGGEKFSEGLVFRSGSSALGAENSGARAAFALGKQFDFLTFTTGWIGKCGVMKDDTLMVYADADLVYKTTLKATHPNQHHKVPLKRCKRLFLQMTGSPSLTFPAYGIGDLVLHRGEIRENTLFTHEKPECPPSADLIDICKPYIHYVPTSDQELRFHDGSTMKKYFDLKGQRIYKGFMLQTSVHLSLEQGPLSGSEGMAAGLVGGAALGATFVAGSTVVGGSMVGSTLAAVGPLMLLAASGEAHESSCAAFNTQGEYNSVTFTVACLQPYGGKNKETLLVGADQTVMSAVEISETMEPATYTVPINACKQLMFWIPCGKATSGKYLIYDIKVNK